MSAQILKRQSSYWDILDGDGTKRIHFHEKEEFYFVSSEIADYSITEDHQLLMDYHSAWSNLYISSAAANPDKVVDALESGWESLLACRRSPYDYLTDTDPIRMLQEGFGLLLNAPNPLVSIAVEILDDAGVKLTVATGRQARWPRKVLIAGDNYVIATSFKVENLAA